MAITFIDCDALSPCSAHQEEFDDLSRLILSTTHSNGGSATTDASSIDESVVINADHTKVTPLFQAIEKQNWEVVFGS
jgi:hypothetical protein